MAPRGRRRALKPLRFRDPEGWAQAVASPGAGRAGRRPRVPSLSRARRPQQGQALRKSYERGWRASLASKGASPSVPRADNAPAAWPAQPRPRGGWGTAGRVLEAGEVSGNQGRNRGSRGGWRRALQPPRTAHICPCLLNVGGRLQRGRAVLYTTEAESACRFWCSDLQGESLMVRVSVRLDPNPQTAPPRGFWF